MTHHFFQIKAKISLLDKGGRFLPIKDGYRPGVRFKKNQQTSGYIELLDKNYIEPGEHGNVRISFHSTDPLGKIDIGISFNFYEGPVLIGSGEVINIIGWIKK